MRVTVQLEDCLWRPLTDSEPDTRFVVSVRSDPRTAPMFFGGTITPEQHLQFMRSPARQTEINWLIERDGTPLGVASIYHFDLDNRKAECGRTIMLEPKLFAQNFAVSAFVSFELIRLNKLWIETLASNRTIARGVERLGMTREGLLRAHVMKDGRPVDVVYFGGTAQDWQRIRLDRYAKWGTPKLISYDGPTLSALPDGAVRVETVAAK